MIKNPTEWHDCRVKLAHELLSDVVHAMLVMSLVHFWNVFFEGLDIRGNVDVMILPDVVQAMDGVCTHCCCEIATADGFWVLNGCKVVADTDDIVGRNPDLTV